MRNRGQSNSKSSSKSGTSDLIARLGFFNVKSQDPSSCEIDEFAIEQFFANYQRTDLFCIMTADHIEHGFNEIAKASETEELAPLKKIIEQLFIFSFCNIIVNDGSERATIFLERESQYTSFPEKFIDALKNLDPKNIDNYPQISDFILNPSAIDFDPEFYDNLNNFIKNNPIPGSIYLLKHFLHNEIQVEAPIMLSNVRNNRPIELKYRPEFLTIPFHESNVPQMIPKSHPYSEYKSSRAYTSISGNSKKSSIKQPHIPSLTSVTVPQYAPIAAIDPLSSSIAFTYNNDIFFISKECKVNKLISHTHLVTAISFSTCGKFILSADCCGDIQVQSVSNGKNCFYQRVVDEAITAVTFYGKIFAIGTISGKILIYETDNEKPLRLLLFHKSAITFLSIHPNCEYISSVSLDSTIRIFSITQASCVRLWKCQTKITMSVRFSHDGKMLIVSCSEGFVYIYDIGSTKLFRSIPIDAPLIDAMFSPNDQMIAVADKTGGFSLWETTDMLSDSLTVLRIDKLKPIAMYYLNSDEIRIIGNLMPNKYFEDLYHY